jgi:polyisoprenoid-binding protein YceI
LKEREDIVRGPFWLNAESFPRITFVSDNVRLISIDGNRKNLQMTGAMTLKGNTAPLEMSIVQNKFGKDPVTGKQAAGFSAKGTFARSQFGITTALGPIGDVVAFEIEVLAISKD